MSFRAVLDASVLVPVPLCDTLLRIAEIELFDPAWSERILGETRRALIENVGVPPEAADRRIGAMNATFPSAIVEDDAVAKLEPGMTNDPGDRHVLAAAVAGGAEAIVTSNMKHFPMDACSPLGVEAIHPDDFLVAQCDLDEEAIRNILIQQAGDLADPPMSLVEVLDMMESFAPRFTARMRLVCGI